MKPKEIREQCQRLGLSQANLAHQLGVRRQTISDWERGVNRPHRIFVSLLSEIFTMSHRDLNWNDGNSQ